MAAYDDLDVKRIFSVGMLSIAVTAVTALAVQVVYYWMVQIQSAETASASDYRRQNSILQEQQNEISRYDVDIQTGNIIIPIDKAIELMVGSQKTESPTDDSQVSEEHGTQQKDAQPSEET